MRQILYLRQTICVPRHGEKLQSVLQDLLIIPTIGSPDIQTKLRLLGIFWNCLIQHPGHWFLHPLCLWQFSFSSPLELEILILGSVHSWRKLSFLLLGKLDLEKKQSIKIPWHRVPLIINQAARFNFGFASNMVLLLWCVCGGLLFHMFEANYLSVLMKRNYEKPVDTAEDIIDMGLTVQRSPLTSQSSLDYLKNTSSGITRQLAERTIIPKVIFIYILKNSIWILNFPKRIGTKVRNGQEKKF